MIIRGISGGVLIGGYGTGSKAHEHADLVVCSGYLTERFFHSFGYWHRAVPEEDHEVAEDVDRERILQNHDELPLEQCFLAQDLFTMPYAYAYSPYGRRSDGRMVREQKLD